MNFQEANSLKCATQEREKKSRRMAREMAPFHARADLTVDLRFFIGCDEPQTSGPDSPSYSLSVFNRSDATESAQAFNLTPGCCLALDPNISEGK